jgi:hypothetical protein
MVYGVRQFAAGQTSLAKIVTFAKFVTKKVSALHSASRA